jgi:gag-polyprotein putative aspartyl protease/Aspartyl protease
MTRRGLGAAMASLCVPSPASGQSDTSINTTRNSFTRVAAEVHLNGQGPFRFVIDTGAQRSAVADTVAAALELPSAPQVMIHGITAATLNATARIARLTLVDETFRDINAPILSLQQLGAHGLIGLDILARFKLGFDTVGRRVTLSQPGGVRLPHGVTGNTGTSIRRRPSRSVRQRLGQLLLTDTLAQDVPVAAFIDTGAQHSIGNRALQKAIGIQATGDPMQTVPILIYGVTGESLLAHTGMLRSLRLGRHQLNQVPLLFADLHCFDFLELNESPALLVGADLIGRFRSVTLDFPAATIDFDRPIRA